MLTIIAIIAYLCGLSAPWFIWLLFIYLDLNELSKL